jgi:hypothetical protein
LYKEITLKKLSGSMLVGLVFLLLTVTLVACGDTPPTVSSVVMGHDFKDGAVVGETTTFKSTDKVMYAVAKVDGTTDAAKVRFVWTAVSVVAPGSSAEIKDRKIVESTVALDKDNNIATNKYTQDNDFPTGNYKVDVYLNDQLVKTAEFTVS